MKVVVVSDSHDNVSNLKKVLSWSEDQGVELVIHCGDVTRPSTLEQATVVFSGEVVVSLGNADVRSGWDYPECGERIIDGYKVVFVHYGKAAKELARSGEYDIVFHGHSHKPWIRKVGDTELVCPGNLADIRYDSTFVFWDTDKNIFELKILDVL